MEYPSHLLPQAIDKHLSDTTKVADRYLLRELRDPSKVIDVSTGLPRDEAFGHPTLQARDVSTSLYGTFTPVDFCFRIVGERKAYWTIECWPAGEEVDPPPRKEFTRTESVPDCLSLSIADIHKLDLPIEGEGQEVNAQCRVVHHPTRANIHHFAARCYDLNGADSTKYVGEGVAKVKGRARAILRTFRNELRLKAVVGISATQPATPEPYLGRTA